MKKSLSFLISQFIKIPAAIRYALILVLTLIGMKTLEYQMYSFKLSQELYLILVASIFLLAGAVSVFLWLKFSSSIPYQSSCPKLTVKEQKILYGLEKGLTNQQLADAAYLSINTIKTQLKKLYKKLGVQSRSEAVAKASALGLLKK